VSTAPDSDNPYVGPRPFRKGELLRGRDREARGLTDKLLGERVVLLHSPSGAGKTSLIQASLVPRMEKAGFQVCARHLPTFSALRVYAPPPTDFAVKNRYVFSAVMGLLGDLEQDPVRLADLSFGQALDRMSERPGAPKYQLVIFDQLEEALTLNPADRDSQLEFFRQVGEALDDGRRWALLSIREDYMGGLDRFTRYLPTGLRSTYRLDFLERDAAFQAIQGPARERGVDFSDEAASELFDDLRAVRVQGPCHDPVQILGPYVEPVHLQVVCHRLWRVLSAKAAEQFHSISAEQITPFRDIAGALGAYYADAVRETAQKTGTDERLIRDWFETQLITARGYRSQTLTGPATNDTTAKAVLGRLERRYLVRADRRAGTTWYELTHDRLVEPVLADNLAWRRNNLPEWQRRADEWRRSGHDPTLLLGGAELREAKRALSDGREDRTPLERAERDYLERSLKAREQLSLRQRTNITLAMLGALAAFEAVLIVFLLWAR
jgi:hypothetical protein